MSQVQDYIEKRAQKSESFAQLIKIEEAKLDVELKLAELRKMQDSHRNDWHKK